MTAEYTSADRFIDGLASVVAGNASEYIGHKQLVVWKSAEQYS